MTTVCDYKAAGVDIDAGQEAVERIKRSVESTFNPNVRSKLGGFAGLYDISSFMREYHHPVLVQSIDGVGTKMMVAKRLSRYDTIGRDLVSAVVNDIVVLGAKPLTFLDYIANDRIQPSIIERIVCGMADSCRELGIALVGGETAEMPGTYCAGEHDLVGVVTGVLERDQAITGEHIQCGDWIIGLSSSGLHTNGYSLARHLVFDVAGLSGEECIPELGMTVGDALLQVHVNYYPFVRACLQQKLDVHGMVHITGGGFWDNIPRILPLGMQANIHRGSWKDVPIFNWLVQLGKLSEYEAFRTFNMGIGFILAAPPETATAILELAKSHPEFSPAYRIGEVVAGDAGVVLK